MRNAVAPMGCEHHKLAVMLAQKIGDGPHRLLQFETNVFDLDTELAGDDPCSVVRLGEAPLRQQSLRVREGQRLRGVVLGDVKQIEFAARRERDAQRVRECGRAQIGKVRRMHDRT